ncbi:MAG: EamA family transporter [Hyphomicrobiales bacterium]|nr:EamA family transporter [Hyphomicrobiales bacterium]
MHASWNALAKGRGEPRGDRLSFMTALTSAECVMGLCLLPFFPAPGAAALPYLVASSVLHVGYVLFLTEAYAHGDLAQIYPIARGAAPLMVAVVGMTLLHEDVGATKALAILCIGLGVIAMSLRGGADLGRLPPRALFYALGTAGFTAAYTIVDALGARASGAASAYTAAMFVLSGAGFVGLNLARRGVRALAFEPAVWRSGAMAGVLSVLAYWVAVWAFTQAPVALVSALRETSVLMAMLIGVFVLREPGGRWRWIAGGLIAGGVALMRA